MDLVLKKAKEIVTEPLEAGDKDQPRLSPQDDGSPAERKPPRHRRILEEDE
jgi:hypothetical protein